MLINLDSEDEGVLTVGCAGGRDTIGTWDLAMEPVRAGSAALEIRVTGLRGGHSGVEIHQGRGNAIKLLNRVVSALATVDARLARLEGGSKRNAIPAEAAAVVCLPRGRVDEARAIVAAIRDTFRAESGAVEPRLDVVVQPAKSKPSRMYKRAFQRQVTRALSGLPHGVTKMNADIPGLVETSTNVAVLTQTPRVLRLATSQRSMVASEIHEIIDGVTAILELGGATVTGSDAYPGWKPNLDSSILKTSVRTHVELYGREPKVEAIHAGLECGTIGEKYPGLDMVSMGPTMREVHSPDEHVNIPSVGRFWDYLLAILRNVE
jgi:dipeptidase D